MAFFDDRKFLLYHIRHSYITCDDTGISEMVMLNEPIDSAAVKDNGDCDDPVRSVVSMPDYYENALDVDLTEMVQSCDIVSDMEFIGAHRRRSNTAQRLERLKKEKKNNAKVKNITWRCPTTLTGTFDFLSDDRIMSDGAQIKKIRIFLTMQTPEEQAYPLEVKTMISAKVQDLIGLICWQYTNEEKEPKLKPNVGYYCLKIAEENGEVDEDFPSLNPNEPVSKFDFPVLALVEQEKEDDAEPVITVHIEDQFSKIQVTTLNITVQQVIEQALKKRKGISGLEYRVEKYHEPGVTVSLQSQLADIGTLELAVIWEDESSTEDELDTWNGQEEMTAVEAPLFHSYSVSAIHKLGKNSEVHLGISGEKVELNPVPHKGTAKFWTWQQKAVTLDVEHIAACEMLNRKCSVGLGVFKLVYQVDQDYKSQVFETEARKAQEIVKKLQYILEMRSSSVYKEYKATKERKLHRKHQKSLR
ncbi:target of rapamycin complex 2 subunit MAPKAP1-like [Limulus polyphemus]|uniref:Target of rapamycin complex 2 subunit MAPKAP1 n=1 Tax=Limulus polyphemus TaxID=6850 RepID=A0ABM1BVF3_LIMPO|nr:target of rapamycin complex 2 subunit MAPKAP1-like [Limulus polyphemus]